MRRLAALFLVATALPALAAQEPDEPIATLKVGTRVVAVAAVVRDKRGELVNGLGKDDFILKQDGKPVDIHYFSQGSTLPLTFALMVDTSGSQRTFIADETAASEVFFRTMLKRSVDRAVLVKFDTRIRELQKMTPSVERLEDALAYLRPSPGDNDPRHNMGGTLLYDAIRNTARFALSAQAGRRAMVILTDGGDNGSAFTLKEAIEEAQRDDVVVYSVFYSSNFGGMGGGRKDVLEKLSHATGGAVFTVTEREPLSRIYAEIAEDLRLTYQIGYNPPDSAPGKFHKIELKMKQGGQSVQAREGYFSPEPESK
ncbi:Ca-activated chloride channel family protein [Granulicella rosea]|uniref:Ca-activated chloride channel family protein n=1 Tax=Granulicella rosea TaxID=474952 RepID=A0A239LUM0_9BACT|nr:VWA domain-containing protein [Granulicella rosea]SNT33399.1 Ca-activated chloride channel family protein [Granulicella rosea]